MTQASISSAWLHAKSGRLACRSKVFLYRYHVELLNRCSTVSTAQECISDHGKSACAELGGECVTERDGYYIVSAICLGFGVLSVLFFLIPTARKLQGEPAVTLRQCRDSDAALSSCSGEQVEDIHLTGMYLRSCNSRRTLSHYILGCPSARIRCSRCGATLYQSG